MRAARGAPRPIPSSPGPAAPAHGAAAPRASRVRVGRPKPAPPTPPRPPPPAPVPARAVGNPHNLGAQPLTFTRQVGGRARARARAHLPRGSCRRPPTGRLRLCLCLCLGLAPAVPSRRRRRAQRARARPPPRPSPAPLHSAPPAPKVIALCAAPFLLSHPKVGELFPADAIARAKQLLAAFSGGIGAYQDSRGNMVVRQEVADFIKARDGFAADPNVRRPGGGGGGRRGGGGGGPW
jgi:hypothetical protein